jgi:hypothetical protein
LYEYDEFEDEEDDELEKLKTMVRHDHIYDLNTDSNAIELRNDRNSGILNPKNRTLRLIKNRHYNSPTV